MVTNTCFLKKVVTDMSKLTAREVSAIKPLERDVRYSDGNGLSLLVKSNGSKLWQIRYIDRITKKQTTISLGAFPTVSLSEAREMCFDVKKKLKQGENPTNAGSVDHHNKTFEQVAREWHERKQVDLSPGYAIDVLQRMEKNLFPYIGKELIKNIDPPKLVQTLKLIEKRGVLDTAKRMKQTAGQVFRYGVASGYCDKDPSRDLDDVLLKAKSRHYATATTKEKAIELFKKLQTHKGRYSVGAALELMPYVFLRPSEVAEMRKEEVFLNERMIKILPERIKTGKPHLVPLSNQAYEIIREASEVAGDSPFVFPSPNSFDKPINAESIRKAMRSAGVTPDEFTPHGFRHMASTLLNEMHYDADAIELQLAHVVGGTVRMTYNHAKKMKYRTRMMQDWADFIDALKARDFEKINYFLQKNERD